MIQPMDPRVLRETTELTEFLSGRFCENMRTDLVGICQDEGIRIITDDYGQAFDGMLVYANPFFYIHLNSARGNWESSRRGRFTLGHELGHFFLQSHNRGIRMGTIPPHASNTGVVHDDKIEAEADNFSSSLLMPRGRLRALTGGRKFSLDIIKEVSNTFEVSLTAALLRFAQVGTHEIMIVASRNGLVEWTFRSPEFPKVPNKFKKGGPVPPSTVAGEAYVKDSARYTTVEEVDFEDWFIYKTWKPPYPLYEQCFYSDIYNCTTSLIWFK